MYPKNDNQIIRRLCPGDCSAQKHEELKRERIGMLGFWFLTEKYTQDWINGQPLLWAHGPLVTSSAAATGKTFISSLLVDHIGSIQNVADQNVATAAFYFQSHRDRQHNVADFNYALSSIAKKLVGQLSDSAVKALQLEKATSEWHIDPELLRKIISSFDSTFIVFDGIDTSSRALQDLLVDVFRMPTQPLNLHIFITSRYPPPRSLADQFQVSAAEIRAHDEDLTNFILQGTEGKVAPEQQQEFSEVVCNLVKLLDGCYPPPIPQNFLWHEDTPLFGILAELVDTLARTPTSAKVETLCEFTITRIKKSRHGRLLYMVCKLVADMEQFGYTPTKRIVVEMLEALAIHNDIGRSYLMDEVQEHCAAFIMFTTRGQVMRSRSPLLRDYLSKESSPNFEEAVVQATLRYLSLEDFSSGPCTSSASLKERFQKHPFLPYAARILSTSASRIKNPQNIIDLFINFSSCRGSVESYLQASNAWPYQDETTYDELEEAEERWKNFPRGYGPLHLACHTIGGRYIIEALLQRGEDIQAYTANGQTALHLAAEIESDSQTLATLLENGAEVSASDNDWETPLSIAVVHGCLDSVKLLLQYGADFDNIDSEILLECTQERPEIAAYLASRGVLLPSDDDDDNNDE